MFVRVCLNYNKWYYISIVKSTVSLVDYSIVKVWILAQLSKLTHSFVEIISVLKGWPVYQNLWFVRLFTYDPYGFLIDKLRSNLKGVLLGKLYKRIK